MDDQAALLSIRVARAADAWLEAREDHEAYRRLLETRAEWRAYLAPRLDLDAGEEELLDELADASPPVPLGEGMADLEARLRHQARRAL